MRMENKMISEDLRSVSAGLGQLAGQVSPKEWDIIRGVKANLESLAEGVEDLENAVMKDEVE